jgi:hypothetical protein
MRRRCATCCFARRRRRALATPSDCLGPAPGEIKHKSYTLVVTRSLTQTPAALPLELEPGSGVWTGLVAVDDIRRQLAPIYTQPSVITPPRPPFATAPAVATAPAACPSTGPLTGTPLLAKLVPVHL